MTAVSELDARRSLEDWLEQLVTADPVERRSVAIAGSDAGLAFERVVCARHPKQALNWLSAFAHLDRTEASHRFQLGNPSARLHQVGDVRPAAAEEQPVRSKWTTSTCTRCDRPVIWTTTSSGKAMPVDARPDVAGSVVLTVDPDGGGSRPLAVMLHTDGERASAAPGSVYMRHAQSCRPKQSSVAAAAGRGTR